MPCLHHSDAAGQDVLDGATVKDGGCGCSSPQGTDKTGPPAGSLGPCCGVDSPGEVLSEVCTHGGVAPPPSLLQNSSVLLRWRPFCCWKPFAQQKYFS